MKLLSNHHNNMLSMGVSVTRDEVNNCIHNKQTHIEDGKHISKQDNSSKNGRDVIWLILYHGYMYVPSAHEEFPYGGNHQGRASVASDTYPLSYKYGPGQALRCSMVMDL